MTDQPALIQPHGFLLALSEDWLVQRASLNVGDFLGRDPRELIGTPTSALLSVDAIHALRNRLALLRGPDSVERMFGCQLLGDERHFDVAVHCAGGSFILEAEPSSAKVTGDFTGTVRGMITRLDPCSGLAELLDAGARQVRAMTGYDRVTIVRFDETGAGEVVAECGRAGIDPTFGTRIDRLSDDARSVYRRSSLHIIADTAAKPVPIVPQLDANGDPLDLSLASLRAADPARVAELREQGVCAAMTLSLITGGRLWGLIDCHHQFERSPGYARRSMADLFAQMFAMRIEISELGTELAEARRR